VASKDSGAPALNSERAVGAKSLHRQTLEGAAREKVDAEIVRYEPLPCAAESAAAPAERVVHGGDDQRYVERCTGWHAARAGCRVAEGDVHHRQQFIDGDCLIVVAVAGTGNRRLCGGRRWARRDLRPRCHRARGRWRRHGREREGCGPAVGRRRSISWGGRRCRRRRSAVGRRQRCGLSLT